jgi:DNA-binding transcriptional MerR regulator
MMHAAIETRGKSADAFRTISEVAADLDVPQHVLRFWEGRFSQIRPVKRAGGRRYYRPDDVDLLRGIRALLYGDGLTIKGVQKILRDHGVRYVADIGRGDASLLGHRGNGKSTARKSAQGVSFEVVQHTEVPPEVVESIVLDPPPANLPVSPARPDLGPESRARLEIRLAELLELKQRLATIKPQHT